MLLPHPPILTSISMICDYYSRSVAPAFTAHSLQEVLKSLRNDFVCAEIYVLLLINVSEPISQRRIANTANYADRFLFCDDFEYGFSKVISSLHIPIEHRIFSVFVSRREKSSLEFSVIFLLALKADELVTNTVPAFFRDYKTRHHEKSRASPSGFRGCAAFVHEAEVHKP